ncbi:Homeobox protein six2 [Rhodosporidiobolus nylandii]
MEVSSTFPARPPVPSSSSTCSSSSRPPLTAFQPPSHPPALSSSSSASALSRRPSLQYSSSLSNLRALPTYSPELPLVNRPASPPKRTNFSAGELLALQTLWNSGAYYPSPTQVEELQAKTGLSWTQIRNWFANRRQRATGEEKARVVKMGRELQVAF